jgi:3-phosphoshikimate 1-carboxyvinyltransferase
VRSFPDVLPITPVEHPLESVVHPPGSKSHTNRALIIAALAGGGVSRLFNPLVADDSAVMRTCLRRLGVMIDDVDDPWLVLGSGGELKAPSGPLDVGASGTTARFVTAIAALADGPVTLDGTERMRRRPIGALAAALEGLGAGIVTSGGFPPVTVTPGSLRGGLVEIDGSESSQFVSALLMLGPMLPARLHIGLRNGELVSRPYVDATIEVMRVFGAEAWATDTGFAVAPGGYHKAHYDIEADASAAVYPAVAAAIRGGVVRIEGIPAGSTQPDLSVLEVLGRMGCAIRRGPTSIEVSGPGTALAPIEADMGGSPDGALAVAVACLFAEGESRLTGLSTLRLKETDRLTALETEIRRLGGLARVEGDDLVVGPGPLRPARIETYDDHRMAMAFSLVGLRVPGIEIVDPGCVSKTWPAFFDVLASLG